MPSLHENPGQMDPTDFNEALHEQASMRLAEAPFSSAHLHHLSAALPDGSRIVLSTFGNLMNHADQAYARATQKASFGSLADSSAILDAHLEAADDAHDAVLHGLPSAETSISLFAPRSISQQRLSDVRELAAGQPDVPLSPLAAALEAHGVPYGDQGDDTVIMFNKEAGVIRAPQQNRVARLVIQHILGRDA